MPRIIPSQPRGVARRDSIVLAARDILAERGRDAFTTEAVAKRAGVAIGTLYRYFADRLDLLDEIQPVHRHGVEAVLELHAQRAYRMGDNLTPVCNHDGMPHPCPTIEALRHGPA